MFSYDVRMKSDDRTPYLVQEEKIDCWSMEPMSNPEAVVELMRSGFQIADLAEEHVYMLALDAKNDLIGAFMVCKGTVTQCFVGNREIYMRALLVGAVNILLVHNHPSGDPSPSEADLKMTGNAARAGMMLGVILVDHIIIGRDQKWCSLRMTHPELFDEPFEAR